MDITEVLSLIQSELNAPKTQFNKFGNYNYRSCEDILEALKPLCKAYKASVIVTDELVLIGDRYYVKATARMAVATSELRAVAYAREPLAQKGMSDPMLTGSASSYSRKYALSGLFAIDDNKDVDVQRGNAESVEPKKKYNNPVFLKEMKEFEDLMGEVEYSKLLKLHNYECAEEIPPKKTALALKSFGKKLEVLKVKSEQVIYDNS